MIPALYMLLGAAVALVGVVIGFVVSDHRTKTYEPLPRPVNHRPPPPQP